jgi:hypothetical protein
LVGLQKISTVFSWKFCSSDFPADCSVRLFYVCKVSRCRHGVGLKVRFRVGVLPSLLGFDMSSVLVDLASPGEGERGKRGKSSCRHRYHCRFRRLWLVSLPPVLAGALDLQGATAEAVDLRAS